MAPLLKKHLLESKCPYPVSVRRSLDILYKRHQHKAEVRTAILQDTLKLFSENNLTPIVIKGAALSYTTYPDTALRPMRDMDLLFRKSEVDQAQQLMRDVGFKQSRSPIPPNHYHLPSLNKVIDDVNICFELHRGLYPDCPPYVPGIDFEEFLRTARTFKVGNTDALTLADKETLNYIYQHAFRAPLIYETYKLINVADIIGFTEKYCSVFDLDLIKNQYSLLYNALPLMHSISPWNLEKIPKSIAPTKHNKRKNPAPFTGWPQKRIKEFRAKGRKSYHIILATFLPSNWWMGVYYGANTAYKRIYCLLWQHPRHVLWWFRLLSAKTEENS